MFAGGYPLFKGGYHTLLSGDSLLRLLHGLCGSLEQFLMLALLGITALCSDMLSLIELVCRLYNECVG